MLEEDKEIIIIVCVCACVRVHGMCVCACVCVCTRISLLALSSDIVSFTFSSTANIQHNMRMLVIQR